MYCNLEGSRVYSSEKSQRHMKSLKKIKTITVRGKRYRFIVKKLKDARGLTDHPETKGKAVTIDERERGKKLLATLIDELIHCAIWEIQNDIVDQISDDMADMLWRCGLRFKDELEEKEEE
jgi:hypothetical protein